VTDRSASTAGQPNPARSQKSIRSSFAKGIFAASALWALVVILGIILYVGWNPSRLGLCIIIVFAAGSVGAISGFIFGIPRIAAQAESLRPEDPFRVFLNSNLGQISDWLTKIIVGVGLIQIRDVLGALGSLGNAIGMALGDQPGQPSTGTLFGLSLALGSAIIAFLQDYMWTTVNLYDVLSATPDTKG
jgi:hypothetical protein